MFFWILVEFVLNFKGGSVKENPYDNTISINTGGIQYHPTVEDAFRVGQYLADFPFFTYLLTSSPLLFMSRVNVNRHSVLVVILEGFIHI